MAMSTHTDEPYVDEVAPGTYAFIQPDGTWWINNAGFVVGDAGVLLVDTCATERRTRALISAVQTTAPHAAITTVVNTHHHGDHTYGNYLVRPATIVATTSCRELVVATGIHKYEGLFEQPDWGDLRLAPPTLTFADQVTMWIGDTCVEILGCPYVAHTTGDAVVWIPETRVLFVGDLLFHKITPFIAFGSLSGSLAALDWLRSFDARVIVPGHGPLATPADLDEPAAYLRFLAEEAARAPHGMTALEAARRCDLGSYGDWPDAERIVGNLQRAIAERRGAPAGAPLDQRLLVTETLAFRDGRLLGTHA
jgi:cyclase